MSIVRNFRNDNSGVVMVLTAIVFPLIVLTMAFTLVSSYAFSEQNRMQAVADQASRYSSLIFGLMGSNAAAVPYALDAAKALARENGYSDSIGGVTVSIKTIFSADFASATFFASYPNAVKVTISKSYEPYFAGIIGSNLLTQTVHAVAGGGQVPCIVALDTGGGPGTGITVAGGARIDAGCPVYSNASDATSIALNSGNLGGSGDLCPSNPLYSICASAFSMVGSSSDSLEPAFTQQDPFLIKQTFNTSVPTVHPQTGATMSICNGACFSNSSGVIKKAMDAWFTANPGVPYELPPDRIYKCVDSSSSTRPIKLRADTIYYIDGIRLTAGASVVGTVTGGALDWNTIIMTGSSSCSGGNPVWISGTNSQLSLRAPDSLENSSYEGFAMVASPTVTGRFTVNGAFPASSMGIDGILAMENVSLDLSCNGIPSSGCQSFWFNDIQLAGGSAMGDACRSKRFIVSTYKGAALLE